MTGLKKFTLIGLSVVSLLSVSSCKKRYSQTTGWEYNNPKNGGFQEPMTTEQETGPNLVLIEGGRFTMGQVEQDVMGDWNNIPRTVTVNSFYMDQTETRNADWLEYTKWLGRIYPDYPEIRRQAIPDTLVWRDPLAYNEPYVDYYLRHPSYWNYPVVGVNWIQANNYAKWRTDRVNEYILQREGVLEINAGDINEPFTTESYLAGQYELHKKKGLKNLDPNGPEERNVRMEDGILLPDYRLPTEAEWEYAAYGLVGNSVAEMIDSRKIYPWNGHYLRNPETAERGQFLANFVRGRGDYMGVAGALNDAGSVTTPVTSFLPNDYGLYNMAGNVAEWVLDVYRPLSPEDVNEFNPFRGNIFETMVKSPDGSIAPKYDYVVYDLKGIKVYLEKFYDIANGEEKAVIESDEITGEREEMFKETVDDLKYSNTAELTDAEEKILQDLLAATDEALQLDTDKKEAEAMDRMQTAIEDLKATDELVSGKLLAGINTYVDAIPGDLRYRSVTMEENLDRRNYRYSNNIDVKDGDVESSIYYNQEEVPANMSMYQDGNKINNNLTTLINNKARIYKGGSWKDRAYWLSPGARRYLDERQSTSYIGFRCAMIRLGSPQGM